MISDCLRVCIYVYQPVKQKQITLILEKIVVVLSANQFLILNIKYFI